MVNGTMPDVERRRRRVAGGPRNDAGRQRDGACGREPTRRQIGDLLLRPHHTGETQTSAGIHQLTPWTKEGETPWALTDSRTKLRSMQVFGVQEDCYTLKGQWKVLGNGGPHTLALSPIEFGNILAAGMRDGTVCVWEELPQSDVKDGETHWKQRAALRVGTGLEVAELHFAPTLLGCILTVLYKNGLVCMYGASEILSAQSWRQVEKFHVCIEDPSLRCHSMSFRPPSEDAPPLFAIGTNKGLQVWMYNAKALKWQLYRKESGPSISSIDWACNTGRPMDFIAASTPEARCVEIWTIDGELNFKRSATLDCSSEPLQVSWDMIGGTLAVRLADDKVALWRQNLLAEWQCTGTFPTVHGLDEME